MKWLLAAGWAAFVVGGLLAGYGGLRSFSTLDRPPPATAQPVAPATEGMDTVAAARPTDAAPTDTPQPVVAAAALRDFDRQPPPFAAAGATDTPTPHGPTPMPVPTPLPQSPAGRLTVLLLGIDQRPDERVSGGDPGRTDSMVLVSIDYDAHTASLVSIPRDGFVVIPDHGNERVNAAYTFGEIDRRGSGPDLAKRTVSQLFGVPVDRYALVDIESMQQVIDTLGGVWIDNPRRLVDTQYPTDDYRTISIDIPAGRQLMNGETAVEYARTRHPDSDYGRQARQQQVLLALRDEALRLNVLPELPRLLPQLLQLVQTDLSPLEIAQLANFGRDLDREHDIVALTPDASLTPSYTGPGGAAYINLTPGYRAAVKELVEQPRVAAERATIDVFNDGAPVGSGTKAADVLRNVGLLVTSVDIGASVPSTRIEAGAGAQHTAALILQTLALPSDALVVDGDSRQVRILLGPDAQVPGRAPVASVSDLD